MNRSLLALTLVSFAAHAQVKLLGFADDHVLVYQASATQGALVKLDETRTPTLVALSSPEWKKASKAATLRPGVSPVGTIPLELTVALSSGKSTAAENGFTWALAPKKKPAAGEPQGHALVTVNDTTGQGNALALDVPLQALTGKLTMFWEVNGAYFAVLAEPASGPTEVFFGRGDVNATTVEVLASPNLAEIGQTVANRLWKEGRSVVRVGKALKSRDQTVVYSTAANAERAKEVADSISGGAPVDKLTWKSDCQAVVAVGESAL
jgi:hypothetical protein